MLSTRREQDVRTFKVCSDPLPPPGTPHQLYVGILLVFLYFLTMKARSRICSEAVLWKIRENVEKRRDLPSAS